MNKSEYLIVDDFQIKNLRVLVLDRNFEFDGKKDKAMIGDEAFSYIPNSVRQWITIKSTKEFKGKKVTFI